MAATSWISSDNTLIIGETGEVRANIESEIVIVSGEVRGDITARRQLSIHKSGRIYGNIHTTALMVEEGAQLNGAIKMSGQRSGQPAGRTEAASMPAPAASGSEVRRAG